MEEGIESKSRYDALPGFDGLKVKRSKQSILFFGEGSIGGKVKPGSLYIILHKDKEVIDALDRAGSLASDAELQQEFDALSRTSVLQTGLDVTGAVLVPQLTWRKQQKSEMVGPWKAMVYNLHNVFVSMKSRHVPGSITDEDLYTTCKNDEEDAGLDDILTEEERKRLDTVLKMENSDSVYFNEQKDQGLFVDSLVNIDRNGGVEHWNNGEVSNHDLEKKDLASLHEEKVNDLLEGSSEMPNKQAMNSNDSSKNESKETGASLEDGHQHKESERVNEYSKGLKPVLWLSPDFPLQTQELLPLLDILANKVKAVRRLWELLTTKLPSNTFPVKVAVPVIPTIKLLVSYTKFEELQSSPLSTPEREFPLVNSSNLAKWLVSTFSAENIQSEASPEQSSNSVDLKDPFMIPADYVWTTSEGRKKKKMMMNQEASGKQKNRFQC